VTPLARVLRAAVLTSEPVTSEPLWSAGPSETQWRRLSAETLEARARAVAIVEQAQTEADAIRARARSDGEASIALAVREAREGAQTELAARWLALRQIEGKHLEDGSDRVVALAVALAERLLGAALDLDPVRVVHLARAIFAEARGARRATIDAHPSDAPVLREQLTTAGLDVQSIEIREDPSLARGELRLQTDLGTIDARLAPRFERLAAALRDALP
jgi:flagellar biosynthesis/type III secretory pathway protein FliH